MAYQTGTAASFDALKAAILTFCTTSCGYTADGTNSNIITKGDVNAELISDGTTSIALSGGTGVTSGALTGENTAPCHMADDNLGIAISWPLTYHFHYSSTPDEVFIFIEYNGGHTQHMLFGEILKAATFTGGAYYSASVGAVNGNLYSTADLDQSNRSFSASKGGGANRNAWQPMPFSGGNEWWGYTDDFYAGSSLHAETESRTWWYSGDDDHGPGRHLIASGINYDLIDNARNIWNQSVALVPFLIFGMSNGLETDSKVHLGEIKHLRYTNVHDLTFGELVTIGSDTWKTYPLVKKNEVSTEYYGLAVRHEP